MAHDRSIPPLTIEALFEPGGIVTDANGDGYPDRLRICIGIDPRLSEAGVWAQVFNLAARMTGEVTALDPPVVKALPDVSPGEAALIVHKPFKRHPYAAELRRSGRRLHLRGSSPERMADVLFSMAVHAGRPDGRWRPWSCARVAEGDCPVMDTFDRRGKASGRFRLSRERRAIEKPGAERLNLLDLPGSLYRISAENPRVRELALGIELPRPTLSYRVGLSLADMIVHAVMEATRVDLPLAAAGAGGTDGAFLRIEERSGCGAHLSVEQGKNPGRIVLRAEGDSRGLAHLLQDWVRIGFSHEGPAEEGVRRLRGRLDTLLTLFAAEAPPSDRIAPVTIRRRFSWRSETDRLIESVSRVPSGRGAVQGLVLISKPKEARIRVRREITRILRAKGYTPAIVVLNAYKPGLSWLQEVVQPTLESIPRLERVRIAFREFESDQPALEMRSRWLQELYPGPDLLAAALGQPSERVKFSMRRRLREAYLVTAWDRGGARVYQAAFSPRLIRLPYLPGHPELGWVHPCTGGVRLAQSSRVLLDENLPTDRERFWRFFQHGILPAIEGAMAGRLAAGECPPAAFWEEAAMEVRIAETDERLGLGEERVAPLEALHEDLYFVLLEHFRLFAEKHRLPAESQFGRILPRVSSAEKDGRPEAVFRARSFVKAPPGNAVTAPAARITSIGIEAGRLSFEIEGGDPAAAGAAAKFCRAARSRGMDLDMDGRKGRFVFRTARPRLAAAVGRRALKKVVVPAPPLDRRLPMQEVEHWVRRLGKLPNLSVWQAGTSWQGRVIWALEAVLAGGGRLVSVARSRLLKPTLLMNARHHANEVSSTNAALRLAWELGATSWGREALKRVNVAMVPIENADGVATLEELLPGCEHHKLHAARYNALGVEWYGDYFLERPRFPEARVKPLLWRRWLPLLVLDAHGVPSHEWDQPFSGYAPGRFRSFWIPRAFIFAILPHIDEISHPGHGPAREISKVMSRAIGADPRIRKMDRELMDRYIRYARSQEPEVFPPVAAKGLTVLPSEKRLAGMNFGVQRFPVTISEIVTEVTDEVVNGRLLELCARGHLTVAKALLEWLGRQAPGRLVRKRTRGSGLVLTWVPGNGDRKRQENRIRNIVEP